MKTPLDDIDYDFIDHIMTPPKQEKYGMYEQKVGDIIVRTTRKVVRQGQIGLSGVGETVDLSWITQITWPVTLIVLGGFATIGFIVYVMKK
jgi:hypothetical protein